MLQLADDGYAILAERLRSHEERSVVVDALQRSLNVKVGNTYATKKLDVQNTLPQLSRASACQELFQASTSTVVTTTIRLLVIVDIMQWSQNKILMVSRFWGGLVMHISTCCGQR